MYERRAVVRGTLESGKARADGARSSSQVKSREDDLSFNLPFTHTTVEEPIGVVLLESRTSIEDLRCPDQPPPSAIDPAVMFAGSYRSEHVQ